MGTITAYWGSLSCDSCLRTGWTRQTLKCTTTFRTDDKNRLPQWRSELVWNLSGERAQKTNLLVTLYLIGQGWAELTGVDHGKLSDPQCTLELLGGHCVNPNQQGRAKPSGVLNMLSELMLEGPTLVQSNTYGECCGSTGLLRYFSRLLTLRHECMPIYGSWTPFAEATLNRALHWRGGMLERLVGLKCH